MDVASDETWYRLHLPLPLTDCYSRCAHEAGEQLWVAHYLRCAKPHDTLGRQPLLRDGEPWLHSSAADAPTVGGFCMSRSAPLPHANPQGHFCLMEAGAGAQGSFVADSVGPGDRVQQISAFQDSVV